MERHIVQSLFEYGYVPSQHREFLFGNDAMHADIFLSPTHPLNRGVVVEIDGPTHFKPIWGEGKLAERIAADRKKTGLALSQGFRMVRLQQKSRHLSRRVLDEAVRLVLGALCGPVEEVILEV